MSENREQFVPSFDDENSPAPAEQAGAETRASESAARAPRQEPTKEHEPTSALPTSEVTPPSSPGVPAPGRKAARPIPAILIVMIVGFCCLAAIAVILVSGVLNQALPPQVSQLVELLTPLPASPSPTITLTPIGHGTLPGGTAGSTVTPTPAVAVTTLASRVPPPASVTLTVTLSPTPKATEPAQPPVPTPIPTLNAPTLTLQAFQPGQPITQAGIAMIYIRGGTFNMGSDASPLEKPIHAVTLSAYYLDRYEVTNTAWAACVVAGACHLPGSTDGYDGKPYYGVDAFNNYPVIFVSWFNADSYCHWRGGRLPTEAEWEMAARWNPATGAVAIYPWGDDWNPANLNYCDASCLNDNPRFKDTSYNDNWPQMAPVGTFPADASSLGLSDMGGNVAEWVADWYSPTYYSASPAENPTGPATGIEKVIRGGSWSLNQVWARGAARNHFGPLIQAAGVGFRCAMTP